MTVECEVCGATTETTYRFCPWCGEPLDVIRELVSLQAPILYHYTSADAAAKIIDSRTLWATEISQLNDASEFRHGIDLALEVLKSRLDTESTTRKEVVRRAFAELGEQAQPKVFVSSFSSLKDSRSQWGLYCGGLGGVALGFDHDKLGKLYPRAVPYDDKRPDRLRTTPLQVNPCVYRERTKRKLISHRIDRVLPSIENPGRPANASEVAAAEIIRACSAFAALLKDESFKDECEWRLVGGKPEGRFVQSRIRNGSPVFYLELSLAVGTDDFPIVEIVVGPQAEQGAAANRWRYWLDQRGLEKVTVTRSSVPLRAV